MIEDHWYKIPKVNLPPQKYEYGLTLDYAIKEINRNPTLLPNISLGFYLFTQRCNLNMFSRSINKVTKSHSTSVPNYKCGTHLCHISLSGERRTTAMLATYFQIFKTPQIAYGPFHPTFSDHERFPNMYQVSPKDTAMPLAMVSLMIHFSWNWVGLIISDDEQGLQFLSDLREEMKRMGVCSDFVNVVSINMQSYVARVEKYYNQIVTSSANVTVIYGDMISTLGISVKIWEYLGSQKIWVTTTQWDTITSKSVLIHNNFQRSFIFSHHRGGVTGFKNFIERLNNSQYAKYISQEYLSWMHFNCSASAAKWKMLSNFSSITSLDWLNLHTVDMAMSETSYNIYNAAYAVAHSLHELLLQQVDVQYMYNDYRQHNDCGKIHHILRNIQFKNPIGDVVNMNKNLEIDTEYDIFDLWNLPQGLQLKGKIGQFSINFPHGSKLKLSEDMIEWTIESKQIPLSVCSVKCSLGFRKFHKEGTAACCFDCARCPENEISNETDMEQCVRCPEDQYASAEKTHCLQKTEIFLDYNDSLGMALVCIGLCFSALTALVFGVFVKHHNTPIVKANNRTLTYILLISLESCFLCSLLFIGHPNTATCILQQTTFGVGFTVAVSTILAKTVTVVLAFKLTDPRKKMRWLLVSGAPNFIIPICTLIQVILCGIWLGTSPPFIEADPHTEHGHIIIVCNKGSVTAFYCVLAYLGSLALGSFTVAFLVRNLPDTFNEAKFLTFSMLVFCSVWVTFLPVYHSTKGKDMAAVEVFSILASSAGLLLCIFAPKCYIIFIRPDRNSINRLRDKTHFRYRDHS